MKKILYIMLAVMTVGFFLAVNSYAGSIVVSGTVKEAVTNKLLPGVKVTFNYFNCGRGQHSAVAYTNSVGVYSFTECNWCDSKSARAEKIGYYTAYKQVYEGSCCSCNPSCPPAYGEIGCRKTYTVNWTLTKRPGTASLDMAPLALKPQAQIEADARTVITLLLIVYGQLQGNETYECAYQWIADIADGIDIPGHPIPLPDCPEIYGFVDLINDLVQAWWDRLYEIRNPDEEPEG